MKIDHIGYAVRNIDLAVKSFRELGFGFGSVFEDHSRNIMIIFGENNGYRIELCSPLHKNIESPLDVYLKSSFGIPYHLCFISNDIDEDMEELIKQGYRVIVEPQPAIAFEGRKVVFLMNRSIGIVELVEGI